MSKSTEGIVYVGRAILEALRSGLEVSTRVNARTSPPQGRGDHHALPPSTALAALTAEALWDTGAAERSMGHRVD